jgi:hypothetical protein
MPSWLNRNHDHRASGRDDSPEQPRAAVADAPVAWIARSVLEALEHSAEYGHPHFVEGELLGYWVTPGVELVVVDWSGFGSLLFREPCDVSTDLDGERDEPSVLKPASDAPLVPLGVWSTGPVAHALDESRHVPRASAVSESLPMVHLRLERDLTWRARLALLPRSRRPWDVLRRPREAELCVFSPRT